MRARPSSRRPASGCATARPKARNTCRSVCLRSARTPCIVTALSTASSLLAALLLLCGCGLGRLAEGQLNLINGQVRLDRAIARERDPERRMLLAEVPRIRRFAAESVGLFPGKSYTGYFETEQKGLTYVVTACERLRLEPYAWWFPIAGRVEYRSYWDEADAIEQARELEAEGYDTWISPSRAYSTLG